MKSLKQFIALALLILFEIAAGVLLLLFLALSGPPLWSYTVVTNPLAITLEEATELIQQKQQEEANKLIKTFAEDAEMQILNGRFGPYLQYKGSNYHLTKVDQKRAAELTFNECMNIVNGKGDNTDAKGTVRTKRTYTRRTR